MSFKGGLGDLKMRSLFLNKSADMQPYHKSIVKLNINIDWLKHRMNNLMSRMLLNESADWSRGEINVRPG